MSYVGPDGHDVVADRFNGSITSTIARGDSVTVTRIYQSTQYSITQHVRMNPVAPLAEEPIGPTMELEQVEPNVPPHPREPASAFGGL